MGHCQSDCRNNQEIDPYNLPKEREDEQESSQNLQIYDAQAEQKVLKIQSFARSRHAKQEVEEIRRRMAQHQPSPSIAQPYEGVMMSDKMQVQKILEIKYAWPARNEFKDLARLPPQRFLKTNSIYKGQWKGGLRYGRGIQFWADGSVYQGDWVNDMADGKGRLIHPDGDFYQGDWVRDRAQGKGQFVHVDGNSYEGDWFEDKQHGYGIEEQKDFVYKGYFQNGLKHGKGIITWKNDNSSYEGDFFEGLMQGQGRFIFANRKIYTGSWYQSKMHGFGELIYPDGRKYIGNFEIGLKNGIGKMLYADGKTYDGQWKDGKQHGKGKVITPDGRVGAGIWENGKHVRNLDGTDVR